MKKSNELLSLCEGLKDEPLFKNASITLGEYMIWENALKVGDEVVVTWQHASSTGKISKINPKSYLVAVDHDVMYDGKIGWSKGHNISAARGNFNPQWKLNSSCVLPLKVFEHNARYLAYVKGEEYTPPAPPEAIPMTFESVDDMKTMTITYRDSDDALFTIVDGLKTLGNIGHTFSVILDPGESRELKCEWDGDGRCFIKDIIVDDPSEVKEGKLILGGAESETIDRKTLEIEFMKLADERGEEYNKLTKEKDSGKLSNSEFDKDAMKLAKEYDEKMFALIRTFKLT